MVAWSNREVEDGTTTATTTTTTRKTRRTKNIQNPKTINQEPGTITIMNHNVKAQRGRLKSAKRRWQWKTTIGDPGPPRFLNHFKNQIPSGKESKKKQFLKTPNLQTLIFCTILFSKNQVLNPAVDGSPSSQKMDVTPIPWAVGSSGFSTMSSTKPICRSSVDRGMEADSKRSSAGCWPVIFIISLRKVQRCSKFMVIFDMFEGILSILSDFMPYLQYKPF